MGNSEFKPTRRELAAVRRYAKSCEFHAALARSSNPLFSAIHADLASSYSDAAFGRAQKVAARGRA